MSTGRYALKERGKGYTDESGDAAESEVKKSGHGVTERDLVSDDATMIRTKVKTFLSGRDDVLLFTGGTGVSSRDSPSKLWLPSSKRS